MLHYFYLLDEHFWLSRLIPALAECCRARSFRALPALVAEFGTPPGPESLLAQVQELPYDRRVWQAVAGECLVLAAGDMPRLPLDPQTLFALIHPGSSTAASGAPDALRPIEQVFWGCRDVRIGSACYRPLHAGWNDLADVHRLACFLEAIDPMTWNAADLSGLDHLAQAEDRLEELEMAREWWPELAAMYRGAADSGQVIVCEQP